MEGEIPGGFWIRSAAFLIDLLLMRLAVGIAAWILGRLNCYTPLELTVLVSLCAYSSLLVGWKGRTLGKWLCGLSVHRGGPGPIGIGRALLRETFGKGISAACLFAGFLWAALSGRKRAWHDVLAGTWVLRERPASRRAQAAVGAVAVYSALMLGAMLVEWGGYYAVAARVMPSSSVRERWMDRPASSVIEASSLVEGDDGRFLQWIQENGASPVDYAVRVAADHQVTLFGEMHGKRQPLQFLNAAIPDLYRRAGVTCIAMETCLAEDDPAIERLVTAPEFDRRLAMTIARHQPWGMWGFKGYWDVLETVWRLNRGLRRGQRKMRVIGLDSRADMPSIAMLGLEPDEEGKTYPPWEKLRIWRVVREAPRVLMRDALFTDRVEREIIGRGEKAIVWIGADHATLHASARFSPQRSMPRMGFMLRRMHGEKIGHVRIHSADISVALVDPGYRGPGPAMAEFLQRLMGHRAHQPVGFDIAGSPFASLRDEGRIEFRFQPGLCMEDLSEGYIYLGRWQDLADDEWLPGYVTDEMFVANKPFYEAFGRARGKPIRTSAEFNAFFEAAGREGLDQARERR